METTTSLIVSKIEKIWRKASDAGATPAERETFEAKALSLMEEHRITMAMLEIDNEDILGDHEYGWVEGRYSRVNIEVVSSVARAYDCRVWWRHGSASSKKLMVFGFKSDAERTILLSKMLVAEAQIQAAQQRGVDAGHTFSLRHSFIQGFSYSIGQRLQEAAKLAGIAVAENHDTTGAALVLVDRRTQMHEKYKLKSLRSAAPTRIGTSNGFARGREAGNTASLSTQGAVVSRKQLAS